MSSFNRAEWDAIQNEARAGVWGDYWEMRRQLADEFSSEYPDQGISSSDMNHMVYQHVKSLRADEAYGLVTGA